MSRIRIRSFSIRYTIVVFLSLLLGLQTTVNSQENTNLPRDESAIFSGSGNCSDCHTSDGDALVDSQGNDLSMPTDWRSTMMANSAKDPYWQAQVEAEVSQFPHLSNVIESTCTRCHTPMGHKMATHNGAEFYSLAEARRDPLAMDGVSCTVCHQIQPDNLGSKESYSGNFLIDDSRIIWGPYPDPVNRPMELVVNYKSQLGSHIRKSELCATCHTLFTKFLDDEGEIAGTFPEQTPYLEWKNSIYSENETHCQNCHMPAVDEAVKISNAPRSIPERSPFSRHIFVGGNTLMLKMLRDNGDEIGVTATTEQFNTTIAHTRDQLQNRTALLEVKPSLQADQMLLSVSVENLTGHKLPTGYPSRRMWLHVRVSNSEGQTVFESGKVNSEGEIENVESTFQAHHEVIQSEQQVQIYEPILKNINGEQTFTLLKAAGYLKDNRLPPKGFQSDHPEYTHTSIIGKAQEDSNFNREGELEGTGKDNVLYIIDTLGNTGTLTVQVELLYQSIAPSYAQHLREHSTPAVEKFSSYYDKADKTPEVLQSTELQVPLNPTHPFKRGDSNVDGQLNLSDTIYTLVILFAPEGNQVTCWNALDANADLEVDITDAIYTLVYLFQGDSPPPEPFNNCDSDLSGLPCVEFPPCDES